MTLIMIRGMLFETEVSVKSWKSTIGEYPGVLYRSPRDTYYLVFDKSVYPDKEDKILTQAEAAFWIRINNYRIDEKLERFSGWLTAE